MAVDKHVFFKDVAKRLAASTLLYKVDSVVHVEDKDDIWFWEQLLLKYRPGRYKFKPATMNEKGNRTAGCAQCLKYKGFLSQKFFICIDSDLRRLAVYLANLHTSFLCNLIYPTFSRILLYSC